MRVRSSARVYQLGVAISPVPPLQQALTIEPLSPHSVSMGHGMSEQITIAEKLQVKFTFFFHFECLEAFPYTVCDRHIVTIKNVVIRAS